MSFSSRTRAIALLLCGLALGGCGYKPLLATETQGTAATQGLVSVSVIPDRVGQMVRNHLRDQLGDKGDAADRPYRLDVVLQRSAAPRGFARDATSTRTDLSINATYQLFDLRGTGNAAVYTGTQRTTVSHDEVRDPFATTVGERAAEERAARQVAEGIAQQVAGALRGTATKAP